MLIIYGECRKNAVSARNLYAYQFHDPTWKFPRVPNNHPEGTEINVLSQIEVHNGVSLRQIGFEFEI